MKITFLGTGASSSFPLPFCHCEICKKAREFGGKNLRKRSSLLVNDDLIIDYGPDVMSSSFMHSIDVSQVQICLQTHSHSDHFDASHLITRLPDYGVRQIQLLHLISSSLTMKHLNDQLKNQWQDANIFDPGFQKKIHLEIHLLESTQSILLGKYKIFAYPTDHDKLDGSLIFVIQEAAITLLYATDTTEFSEEIWQSFRINDFHFNIIILDQTYGLDTQGEGHLNANQVIAHIQRMKNELLINQSTKVWATHLSHEGNHEHEIDNEITKKYGYQIAYDGLIFEI